MDFHPALEKPVKSIKKIVTNLEYETMRLWACKQSKMSEKAIYKSSFLEENEVDLDEIIKIYEKLLSSPPTNILSFFYFYS
jgi:hypothetical protein